MLTAFVMPIAVLAAPVTASPQAEITAAMDAGVAGWNAGDLDRFMAMYADDAIHASGNEIARGKAEIAARYAKDFGAGSSARGTLSFQPLAFRTLSAVHVLMVARWALTAAAGSKQSGTTTLLFERRKAGWRIISDHSS